MTNTIFKPQDSATFRDNCQCGVCMRDPTSIIRKAGSFLDNMFIKNKTLISKSAE